MWTNLRNLSGEDNVELLDHDDEELSVTPGYRVRRQCLKHRKLVIFLVGALVLAGVVLALVLTLKKPKSVSKGESTSSTTFLPISTTWVTTSPSSNSSMKTSPTSNWSMTTSPTSKSSIKTSPTSNPSMAITPTSNSSMTISSASTSSIKASPTSNSMIKTSPTSSSSIKTSPTSASSIKTSPASNSSMTTSPVTSSSTTTTSPTKPPTPSKPEPDHIAQVISNQLDKNVDPCDDFYSYACGGFSKTHHLTTNQSYEVGFTIVNDDNMKILRKAIENAASNYSQSSAIVKTAKIYDSCINTTAIERQGNSPLENLITKYGGWTVTGNGTNLWSVTEKMGRVLRDLNVQTLLSVTVATDPQDSSKHILSISISSLGMGISYYFDTSSQGRQVRAAYKTYMKTIARLLGGGLNSEQKMMHIYNLENKVAQAVNPDSVSEDIIESLMDYHRSGRSLDSVDSTIYNFCSDSGFSIGVMRNFLDTAFANQKKTFSGYDKVYYPSSEAYLKVFKAIANQYKRTSVDTVKDYIMWRVIDKYVMSMPYKFVQAKLKFQEALIGRREYKRWSYCLESMLKPMGMPLGRLYVDANFDETTKKTVKDMTSRLRKAFIDNLDSANWMDYHTKQSAKEKARAIKEDVGYPPYIKNDAQLDRHYSELIASSDYFENSVVMNRMMVQKNFGMLGHPVNKDLWAQGPAEVNGYYSPQQNRIVFLAGILQPPFYRKSYPKYLNYGSLAMVIGHEITHGFDSQGRLFDKNGNVKDWWSLLSKLEFYTKAKCLIDQYEKYQVFGENLDGTQTLNENIADNGGIKLAYDAYQSWVNDNKEETWLPGLNLSVDQLFFIGFATPWCSVYKKQAALFQLKNDVHSYPKFRVIGPLSNFQKFADAFSCRRGSKMNPYTKCSVW